MQFDAVIMNLPYDKNLHLKILSKIIEVNPNAEVVNLSPIRWLQDPLAEYKKGSDWNNFKKLREFIYSITILTAEEAQNLFGSWQYEPIGIYHIDKTKNTPIYIKPRSFISWGVI